MLWLWCKPAGAAPIKPLAGEHPYAMIPGQKDKKKGHKRFEQAPHQSRYTAEEMAYANAHHHMSLGTCKQKQQ